MAIRSSDPASVSMTTGPSWAREPSAPASKSAAMRGSLVTNARSPQLRQRRLERLDEEVFAPHHRFVHAEFLGQMIDAALYNAFPLLVLFREVLLAQGAQNQDGGGVIEVSLYRI